MVVKSKADAKREFAKRLNDVLDELTDAPTPGRPAWIVDRYDKEISGEAARKWIKGRSLPDMAHLAMISADLKVGVEWLLTGLGDKYLCEPDDDFEALKRLWQELTPDQRKPILSFIAIERERVRSTHDPGNEDAA